MAILRSANTALFHIRVDGLPDDELAVLRLRGEEGLSRLYEFELELVSENPRIAFPAVVGQPVTLTLLAAAGERHVSGIVGRFEQGAIGRRFTKYYLQLVPRVWRLQQRLDSRIFQSLSAPEIVRQVLQDAGIPASAQRENLKASYAKREYCVQYQESDWAFISRLLEEEGIFYGFEHHADRHLLLFGDDPSAHADLPGGESTLVFREPAGFTPQSEYVDGFRYAQSVRTGAAVLRDYDFKKPDNNLEARDKAELDLELESFEFPGRYCSSDEGQRLASVRLQECEVPRKLALGHGVCPRFTPGYRFELAEHGRDDFNQPYLLTQVTHRGYEPQALQQEAPANETESEYSNEFRCIPAASPYRPPRLSPRPNVPGPQSAVVVGPKGQEIYTDEYGRIKVQFHWDRRGKRDENSSCWMRVATPWAGAQWGSIQIPRIGWEVIVSFLNGDIDQPLVVGSVYNANQKPPFALPAGASVMGMKSSSTPGGGGHNEISADDTKGKEKVTIHAQYDMGTTVQHDQTNTVNNDFTETIKQNAKITISEGIYSHDVAVGTATYHVKAAVTENFEDTQTTNVKKLLTIKSLEHEILIDAKDKITLQSGESKIELFKDGHINVIGVNLFFYGKTDAKTDSPKVAISGTDEAVIGCGNQTSKYDKAKTAHSGAAINSSAVGVHEITGAVVKIN